MNITLVTHIEGMEDLTDNELEDFEYDLKESTRTLLVNMGVDFKDLNFQFSNIDGFEHEE